MSIKIMSEIWNDESKYEGATLLLLLALADFANDDGVCWPSIARIGKKARVSERWVHEILRTLCKEGALSIDPQAGPKGVNVYTIHPWGAVNAPGIDNRGVVAGSTGGVVAGSIGGWSQLPPDPSSGSVKRSVKREISARARTELEPEPEPEPQRALAQPEEPSAAPFAFTYAREYQNRHGGRPPPPVEHAGALALERDYGGGVCIEIARDFDWQKHPSYLRKVLESRRLTDGRLQTAGQSSRRSARFASSDDIVAGYERYKTGDG